MTPEVKRSPIAALTLVVGAAFVFGLSACEKKSAAPASADTSADALVSRGKTIYQTTCIACHNTDPHQKGSIGPDVYGSSKELVRARVLESAYPPGYKPKGDGKVQMPKFPQFKDDIDAIHAYLNSSIN